MVLVTGMYTTGALPIVADSTNLKQETKQNANCDTVGARKKSISSLLVALKDWLLL